MQYTTRLASNPARLQFPLAVDGPARWKPVQADVGALGSVWQATVDLTHLPELTKAHIIVPSYACLDSGYQYQWTLHCTAPHAENTLAPIVPSNADKWSGFAETSLDDNVISAKIDCWHTERSVGGLSARLTVYLPASTKAPADDLLSLSLRPLDLTAIELPKRADAVCVERPLAISQMQADASIAKRICSPTATAMAVAGATALAVWPGAITACLDPATKAYGKWPLAIYWTSQHGRLGAVEALVNWQQVLCVLRAGTALVCSIRFAKSTLPGAPMEQSGGHLLVLYGIEFDSEEGYALVMDPAADSNDQVSRRYKLQAFSDAWLAYRGGAYLFTPNIGGDAYLFRPNFFPPNRGSAALPKAAS